MKKFATSVFAALAICFTCAATFASSTSEVAPAMPTMNRVAADPVASTLPAQLLTVTCRQSKGGLRFTEAELNTMVDASLKDPQLVPKVCSVFSKRV